VELASRGVSLVAAKLEDVRKVATSSKNLKGTYQKLLKGAADSIKEATASLVTWTVNDEMAQLQAANQRLQAQLEELRRETACLRADLAKSGYVETSSKTRTRTWRSFLRPPR
jgi:chlorite dismutase